jgi:hypothetical protein
LTISANEQAAPHIQSVPKTGAGRPPAGSDGNLRMRSMVAFGQHTPGPASRQGRRCGAGMSIRQS